MSRDIGFWALIALAAAAALAYGLHYLRRPPSLTRALVKTGALGLATLAIALFRPSPIVLPLAFSALGDFALAFDKKWALPLGIGAFLIAQLFYLLSFFGLYVMGGYLDPIWPRHLAMVVIGGGAIAYLIWLWPRLKWMALGIVPYAAAIAGMAMMSFWIDWRGWPAMVGAVLFLISDGVLAAELFKLAPDAPTRRITAPVVWWTYIAAQALIVTGLTFAVTSIQ